MKRLLAGILAVGLLLSLAACSAPQPQEEEETEKKVSHYLVTEHAHHYNGEVKRKTTFTYDEKGRPLTATMESESVDWTITLSYDKKGNLIGERYETPDGASSECVYTLTYEDDRIVAYKWEQDGRFYLDAAVTYDEKGNLTDIAYTGASGGGQPVWHNFAYDEQNRLVQETRCLNMPDGGYRYDRICYTYGEDSVKVERLWVQISRLLGQEALAEVQLHTTSDVYTLYFDKDGTLLGHAMGDDPLDPEDSILDDPRYVFDKNDNLTFIKDGRESDSQQENGTAYSYESRKLTKDEAAMSRRLCHAASTYISPYALLACMDPMYAQNGPILFTAPPMWHPLSYLIPYPMW